MIGLLLANAVYFAIGTGLLPLLRIARDRATLVERLPLAYPVGVAATGIIAAHLALIDVPLGLVELVVLAAVVLFLGLRRVRGTTASTAALRDEPLWSRLVGGGALTALAAQTRYFDRWRARRHLRSLLGTRATFEMDDSGVLVETVTISGHIPWSAVTELRANDRILVLMRDRVPVAWIPASAFSSAAELDQVVAFMPSKIETADTSPPGSSYI